MPTLLYTFIHTTTYSHTHKHTETEQKETSPTFPVLIPLPPVIPAAPLGKLAG